MVLLLFLQHLTLSQKIKVISREDEQYTRSTSMGLQRSLSNPDPQLHLFEKPREVVRAVNTAKYQQILAKPFVADLSGHSDTPLCLAVHPKSLRYLISGSGDGEIRI